MTDKNKCYTLSYLPPFLTAGSPIKRMSRKPKVMGEKTLSLLSITIISS